MELLQLRYFCKLAQKEHLTQTAEELMISPPSLSHTIRQLEQDLGVPLFDRVGRNIRLNDYGKIFLKYAQRALNELEQGAKEIQALQKQNAYIRIALTHSSLWDSFLMYFRENYSNTQLRVSIVDKVELLTTSDFAYDFFLGNKYDLDIEKMEMVELYPEETPCVAVSIHHPLANRTVLDLRDLKDEVFFSFRNYGFSTENWQALLFQIAGLRQVQTAQGDALSRIKSVRENRCIALTSTLGFQNNFFDDPGIKAIPLSFPIVPRQQVLAWKSGEHLSPACTEFVACISAFFNKKPKI